MKEVVTSRGKGIIEMETDRRQHWRKPVFYLSGGLILLKENW